VRRDRRCDHHGVEIGVRQQVVEVLRRPGAGVAGGEPLEQRRVEVAEPRQLGELVEVADEVLAPAAEARDADAQLQSFQTLPPVPSFPVAFRKSTTR
jgi:hypothetical protein